MTRRFARVGEVPFSSERKLMSTLHTDAETEGRVLLFTKGAPDVLLTRCTHELVGDEPRPLSRRGVGEILEANDALAGRALRTLGVAYRASIDGTLTPTSIGEQTRARSRVRRPDRHDRSAARRGAGRGRAGQGEPASARS